MTNADAISLKSGSPDSLRIAVLGLGAMGSRMAANLLKAGHPVTVWNRTPGAETSLVNMGAAAASTPKEAVADADFVIAMVRDDRASKSIWLAPDAGALAGLKMGAIAIESSTVSPAWINELGTAFALRGATLLDAPVAGSRPQAEAGQLVYLVGGNEADVKRAEPVLRAMGSAVHHVGPLGSGALVKLSTNALMGVQLTALAELIGLLKRAGADPASALKAISGTPAWSPAAGYLTASMLAENFAPQFPVELIEKDFGYTVDAAHGPGMAPTIAAAGSVFRQAIDAGFGAENMTSVVRLFTK